MVNIGFSTSFKPPKANTSIKISFVAHAQVRSSEADRAGKPTFLVVLAYCRARQAEDGQNADNSLYFMVLDVIEEPGGRFNIMGKTEGEESILVQVQDFEPYFYIGQPVFKASPQGQALTCTVPLAFPWAVLVRLQ